MYLNMFCYFGMFQEADSYSYNEVKSWQPYLELLSGDNIDISEWVDFELYEIAQFCNNQSDDIKPMLG